VDEINHRTVVNRGYYAVFHLANELADKMSLPEAKGNGGGSHQRLFNRLIDESNKLAQTERLTLKCIGYVGSRTLKPFRVKADYEINDPLPEKAAAQTLANAQKVFDKAKLLPL
jgi:uncharacterized protein (UPF0332 family)